MSRGFTPRHISRLDIFIQEQDPSRGEQQQAPCLANVSCDLIVACVLLPSIAKLSPRSINPARRAPPAQPAKRRLRRLPYLDTYRNN